MSATDETQPPVRLFDGEPGTITVVRMTDEIVALELDGEFDVVEAPRIVEQADRLLADDKHLIVDLSSALFIDSAVIHALFRTDANARGQGRTFVLQFGTGSGVATVLAITGADRDLDTAATREAAIDLIERRLSSRSDGRR